MSDRVADSLFVSFVICDMFYQNTDAELGGGNLILEERLSMNAREKVHSESSLHQLRFFNSLQQI